MLQVIIYILICFYSMIANAQPLTTLYQIDLILFTHLANPDISNTTESRFYLPPDKKNALMLQHLNSENPLIPYNLLPEEYSHLKHEFWTICNQSTYQVLTHLSWIQPSQDKPTVVIPDIQVNNWQVEGTITINQDHYYNLKTDLLFSSHIEKQQLFEFKYKRRLKAETIYYIDHPHAGMLIKIHKVA